MRNPRPRAPYLLLLVGGALLGACRGEPSTPAETPAPAAEPPRYDRVPRFADVDRMRSLPAFANRKGPNRLRTRLQRIAAAGGFIPQGGLGEAFRELEEGKRTGRLAPAARVLRFITPGDTFTSLGPSEMTPLGSEVQKNAGRVMALAIDPRPTHEATHWLATGQNGGIWQTLDGGTTWVPKTDSLPSLAMGAIAFAPSDPQIIYGAAGEWGAGGLYKSTDGGATWQVLAPSTFAPTNDKTFCTDLKVHPTDPNILLATLVSWWDHLFQGIYRSTDGGATWTQIKVGGGWDLEVDPTNFQRQYAGLGFDHTPGSASQSLVANNGLWRSFDGGATFSEIALPWAAGEESQAGRIELALSPANPNVLHVVVMNFHDGNGPDGQPHAFFRTTNAWAATPSFSRLMVPPQSPEVIIADRSNANVLYGGGFTEFYRWDGSSWAYGPFGTIHVDQQAMAWAGNRLVVGNDGGVVSTIDGGNTWTSHSSTLRIAEFIEGSVHPTDPNMALAAGFDNGTALFTGTPVWRNVTWGDGGWNGFGTIDPDNHWFTSFQWSGFDRTRDGGETWQWAGSGIDWGGGGFFFPIERCPNGDVVLVGTNNLWRANDFFAPAAPSFTSNGPEMGVEISAIAFAPSDPTCNTYAFGTASGQMRITADGGQSWMDLDADGQIPNRFVSDLAFAASEVGELFVTLGGFDGDTGSGRSEHLYTTHTSVFEPSWSDISPPINAPHLAVAVHPASSSEIYVGTALGAFASQDGGNTWAHLGPEMGLPNVQVSALSLNARTGYLTAFTTGRGAFRIGVGSLEPPPAPGGLTVTPDTGRLHLVWFNADRAVFYRVKRGSSAAGPFTTIATTTSPAYVDTAVASGITYYYLVSGVNEGGEGPDSAPASATTNPCLYEVDGASASYFEAEAQTSVSGPFERKADVTRSGGVFIVVTEGSGSHTSTADESKVMTYDLDVTNGGSFFVWLLVSGPNTSSDSFWVSLDGGPNTRVNTPGTWGWVRMSTTATTLASGAHTLEIKVREDGSRVDKVLLTKSSTLTPTGLGGASLACSLPTTPINLDGVETEGGTAALLTWTDLSDNETGFAIERRFGLEGTFAPLATVGANVTSYTDGGLGYGQYRYRVRATNAVGPSGWSEEAIVNVAGSSNVYVYLEAESGMLSSPLQTLNDANASGGQFIRVAAGNNSLSSAPPNGRATYNFSVATGGTYKVWGRVIAPNTSDDSFWVRMDGGTWVKWNEVALGAAWHWDQVHDSDNGKQVVSYSLTAGSHALEVAYREDGTRLDRLLVTNDSTFVPQ